LIDDVVIGSWSRPWNRKALDTKAYKDDHDPGLRTARGEDFTRLLRPAYRVLLTRGIKGTRLLCLDEETRHHIAEVLTAASQAQILTQ
jgi:DUF2075 family protein